MAIPGHTIKRAASKGHPAVEITTAQGRTALTPASVVAVKSA